MRIDLTHNSPVLPGILRSRGPALMAVLAASLCGAQIMAAQAPTTSVPSAPAHKPAHPHKPPVTSNAQSSITPAAATVPEQEAPKWPVNEKPLPATVTWDSQGLRIDATNSSLAQILADVSTATGATVEGFDTDQRVFGVYGPGPARDVLSQLLQGSGYNVILVGDQGQGTPRLIVLSLRHAGTTTAAANSTPAPANDEDSDTEEQPQPAASRVQPVFPPGRQPLTPQQMQQQMMQQRPQPVQPQPVQPPNNPQN
ncbi:MAG TPA: hypothetical protein VKF63_06130 [Terracidiphilus sp.]|nr:hypothetical protein [Terracidiphilus sp.]